MLRTRLALTIATALAFVLLLGLALYWGASQAAARFQSSQAAYQALARYQRLSGLAYRQFADSAANFLAESAAPPTEAPAVRQDLLEALNRLRASVADGDGADPSADPELIARLSVLLETGLSRHDQAERLAQQGERLAAARLLADSAAELDAKFAPLAEAAGVEAEARARRAAAAIAVLALGLRWTALCAALIATLFGAAAGFLLFRGIRRPMAALLRGADAIASGNLSHRIPVEAENEFGFLAGRFNRMAQGLELQRNRLRDAQAVLERKVAERTLELNKLNRELQSLDQRRREFFADISHELRTPITVIRGEAEVTLRGGNRDPEEYREALERILELAAQQGKMVNDLLFLARAEAAQLPFEWERLDLAELVADAAEDIAVLAREKSIAVGLAGPEAPVWIRGDRQRLRQVMFILGDNACRYSEPGGRIDLALAVDAGQARLSVADQGIGIPAQDLEGVFVRYFRAGNTRRPDMQGSGLGLPMAKAIVEAHGGGIAVSSAVGEGTTFTLRLPLEAPSA
jgi:signal transduction histidine kinase